MRQKYKGQLEELLEKVQVYEAMFHDIQMYTNVILDHPPMQHMISIIGCWSYAHRQGNGEFTDKETDKLIRKHFEKMKNREWTKSGRNSGVDTRFKPKKD